MTDALLPFSTRMWLRLSTRQALRQACLMAAVSRDDLARLAAGEVITFEAHELDVPTLQEEYEPARALDRAWPFDCVAVFCDAPSLPPIAERPRQFWVQESPHSTLATALVADGSVGLIAGFDLLALHLLSGAYVLVVPVPTHEEATAAGFFEPPTGFAIIAGPSIEQVERTLNRVVEMDA